MCVSIEWPMGALEVICLQGSTGEPHFDGRWNRCEPIEFDQDRPNADWHRSTCKVGEQWRDARGNAATADKNGEIANVFYARMR